MFWLSIDTSSNITSVAIADIVIDQIISVSNFQKVFKKKISFCVSLQDNEKLSNDVSKRSSHSERLMSLCYEVVNKAGIKINELEGIIIGSGPGSFTGLRIGYSFVKGLAMGLKIPVITYCSLMAYANDVKNSLTSGGLILALGDAGRDEVFVGLFKYSINQRAYEENLSNIKVLKETSIMSFNDAEKMFIDFLEKETAIGSKESIIVCAKEELLEITRRFDNKVRNSLFAYPTDVAVSLLEIFIADNLLTLEGVKYSNEAEPLYNASAIAMLQPNYMRKVNAKTIEERRKQNI